MSTPIPDLRSLSIEDNEIVSPFLRLPFEIRLMIYEFLLFPSKTTKFPPDSTHRSFDAESDPFTLTVRTIDPSNKSTIPRDQHRRSIYHVQTGTFLRSTLPTTYHIPLTPSTQHLSQTIPSLLPLCRQIHAEAAAVLYSSYTFSFNTCIEATVPFFSDLTPLARRNVRSVQVTKKPGMWTKEYDREEWRDMCAFLAHMKLKTLKVGVVSGEVPRPGMEQPAEGNGENEGWLPSVYAGLYDDVKPIKKEEFEVMRRMQLEWKMDVGGADLEWVDQLMQVRGLKEVKVGKAEGKCPNLSGEGMKFWAAFSRSLEIEGGFEDWVRGVMIESGDS